MVLLLIVIVEFALERVADNMPYRFEVDQGSCTFSTYLMF